MKSLNDLFMSLTKNNSTIIHVSKEFTCQIRGEEK